MSSWARHYLDALFDISTFTIYLDNNYTLADLNFFYSFLSHLFVSKNTAELGFKKWKFSSVAQSCLTLWNPKDCSMQGFPVHHRLPEFTQTHVHWVSDAIQPSHPLPSLLLPSSIFPSIHSFQMNQFFTSGGQSIGVSASASVLPMNIQDWFPLGWTGWISSQSKGLSRVFSQFKSIHSSAFSFLYSPTLTSIHDYQKNHNFD